ncbi:MAG TPA: hypothetical protein EYQ20_03010 [candidate division Zixibacteria bacterium]|nr:hypothetical protein [candidate division Zixibacteria bacterium]
MSSRITQNMTLFMGADLGFALQLVALATGGSLLIGLFSKVFFGWLVGLASLKGISICYVIIALSIALAFGIQGFITLMIFQLSRGFAHSGILIETPILEKHIFSPFHLGKVIGTFSAIAAVGLTFRPITVAKLCQMTGNSYYPALCSSVQS